MVFPACIQKATTNPSVESGSLGVGGRRVSIVGGSSSTPVSSTKAILKEAESIFSQGEGKSKQKVGTNFSQTPEKPPEYLRMEDERPH